MSKGIPMRAVRLMLLLLTVISGTAVAQRNLSVAPANEQRVALVIGYAKSMVVTTGFAVFGGILFCLIAGRYWGKAKAKPYQLGLWWGAWLVAASVMVVGGSNYQKGWFELFGSLVANVLVYFFLGFVAGYVFRKIKPLAE